MDVKRINPFIDSFNSVMPQLGFSDMQIGQLSVKNREVIGSGVLIVLGIVGDIRGNVVYMLKTEDAMKIASIMMMGEPVEEFDDMAGSALSELTNMLTATAATHFYELGIKIDISTPTLLQGKNVSVKMASDQILCVELLADGLPVDFNLAFEN